MNAEKVFGIDAIPIVVQMSRQDKRLDIQLIDSAFRQSSVFAVGYDDKKTGTAGISNGSDNDVDLSIISD